MFWFAYFGDNFPSFAVMFDLIQTVFNAFIAGNPVTSNDYMEYPNGIRYSFDIVKGICPQWFA